MPGTSPPLPRLITATAAALAVFTAPTPAHPAPVAAPTPVAAPLASLAAPVPTATQPVRPVVHTAAAPRTTAGHRAMTRALSKLGAPYRWGAAGPNAFDCSGLVSWAYQGSGVSLPRSSRAMSRVGTPVARADLRPGDLVFFYRPVSHVGIYIGAGKIVHASSRKHPVKISDMGRMKFNSARRI